jgi:phenylpyruvate tautomerase PptA (4-oxalocrotonate tautomerase family)
MPRVPARSSGVHGSGTSGSDKRFSAQAVAGFPFSARGYSFYLLSRSSGAGGAMPIIDVRLIAGYPVEARARLARALTRAVSAVIAAPPEATTVVVGEIAPENYFRGGVGRRPAEALPDPEEVARRFLAAMEARDLAAARALTAPGFAMTFPGGVRMTDLEALVEWARGRYRFVTKSFDGFAVAPMDDHVAVFCHGTLAGEWPDGGRFEGIRFADRFEVEGGLIRDQQVWNDMALHMAAPG